MTNSSSSQTQDDELKKKLDLIISMLKNNKHKSKTLNKDVKNISNNTNENDDDSIINNINNEIINNEIINNDSKEN